jgi:hypothetical protein
MLSSSIGPVLRLYTEHISRHVSVGCLLAATGVNVPSHATLYIPMETVKSAVSHAAWESIYYSQCELNMKYVPLVLSPLPLYGGISTLWLGQIFP